MSIGTTSISDTAKGIQRMMEMGVKTVDEMDKKEQKQQEAQTLAAVAAAKVVAAVVVETVFMQINFPISYLPLSLPQSITMTPG